MEKNQDSVTDRLLSLPPYMLSREEKKPQLLQAMNESYSHHFLNCSGFRKYCERRGYSGSTIFSEFEDMPFIPIQAFKESAIHLISVSNDLIQKKIQSSATSGISSTIFIDKLTSKRQIRALASVLVEVMGGKRRPFLIADADPRKIRGFSLGARSAAVQGFLNLARESHYIMELDSPGKLSLRKDVMSEVLEKFSSLNEPVVIFGFTFVLYADVVKFLQNNGLVFKLPQGSSVIHIGGWKKLEDQKVSKVRFNQAVSDVFGVSQTDVVDFYGFTEQLGVTYPDGADGLKHVPNFAEVIVRDPATLKPVADGREGLLQFLTPLPYSYAGISVLTDDIGVVVGRGQAENGWHGTSFKIIGRAAKAEVRGCGDIMGELIARPSSHKAVPNALGDCVEDNVNLLFDSEGIHVPQSLTDNINISKLPTISDLPKLFKRLLVSRNLLDKYSIDELVVLISAAAQRWGAHDSPLLPLRQQGVSFLMNWCSSPVMRGFADRSLRGERGYLDGFRPVQGSNQRLIRAVPRGICVHWLSGNVALLGMLALVQSILTRNANVLKVASTYSSVLPMLLNAFRDLNVTTPAGRVLCGNDILSSIAVVYFPHSNRAASETLSMEADVRLAWGGREAVETIANLPKKYNAEDIIFGPKISYMAIGRESLAEERKVRRLARNAATDVSVFDQYACSSPHTIFVEKGGLAASPREFAMQLALEMERASIRIPKATPDAGTVSKIGSLRMKYEFTGELWNSLGTEWTVLYDEAGAVGLGEICYSRVVTVRAVDDILDVAKLAHPGIQTIGLALGGVRKFLFADVAAALGAERFPDIGRMTYFDIPWDGLYAMERMVRWVSMGGPY